MENTGREPRVPYFFREKLVRWRLNGLYEAVIGSNVNAETLLKKDFESIDESSARGNVLARRCFITTLEWLRYMKEFVMSEEIYMNYFLKPVKSVCRFLLSVRELSPSSTDISGVVLSVSSPFKNYFKSSVVSISIASPELQSVLNVRCDADSYGTIGYGTYSISGVQPIPFINRLHPTRLCIGRSSTNFRLSDLDFIKLSFYDLKRISHSIDLKNVCEIPVHQKRSRSLARPFVVAGRISSVRSPQIVLKDAINGNQATALMFTNKLLKNLNISDIKQIEQLKGAYVRVLAILPWEPDEAINYYPEVIYIEVAEHASDLILDDLIGYVMLRECVNKDELFRMYPRLNLSSVSPSVSREGELVKYEQTKSSDDPIISKYLTEKNFVQSAIRATTMFQPLVLSFSNVFDVNKIAVNGVAKIIERDGYLQGIFLFLLKTQVQNGSIPRSLKKLAYHTPELLERLRSAVRWLVYTGCLTKSDGGLVFTNKGYEVAYTITGSVYLEKLKSCNKHLMNLQEIADTTGLPVKLILCLLQGWEKLGLVNEIAIGRKKSGLLWALSPVEENDQKEAEVMLKSFFDPILSVLNKLPHGLALKKIKEELEINGTSLDEYVLNTLLSELHQSGVIEQQGDTWFFPWDKRVENLLNQNSGDVFTTEEIIEKIHVPPIERSKVMGVLEELLKQKKIARISPDRWTHPSDLDVKNKKLLKSQVHEYAIQLLKSRGGRIFKETFSGALLHYAYKITSRPYAIHPKKICEELVAEMVLHGEMVDDGDIYRVKTE